MTKNLYMVTSGDSYYVRANSEEEAEAIYHVNMGNMDLDAARENGFNITTEDMDSIEFIEASTIVEPVMDFSNPDAVVFSN